ncbi:NAD(P)-dependent alcohol dehydrogenase [Nonomuraea jabiensis]|uniref:Aryl-alcohol dehydrogenase n=1 Tax=Nonomuraea jabiensis TaxID=882448 RepID=A0A7W9G999_9ACTN|nr:NAD(P)-dependent alcohol dehydrogenase [Nonomuraea jabiensis]MBB5779551.1 aryl-alcohol dehydrogenase [Nonomuraea jabiensis]
MTTTQAAVVESPGAAFTLRDVELDAPRQGEILVRMKAAGICHTDLTVAAGHIPFPLPGVLGHEGAGVVEETGPGVTKVKPGDHVVLTFTSCGSCASCRIGHPAYCTTWIPQNLIGGKRADGSSPISRGGVALGGRFFGQSSFARHSVADERSVVKVDPDLPFELLAPLACSVQTGTGAVWNTLRPEPGTSIAVIGTGAVGLAAVMGAALTPVSQIIAVGRQAAQLELAAKIGATHTVDSTGLDLAAELRKITGGAGVDYVVEAVGNPDVLRAGIEALAPRGAVAVVGAPPYGVEVSVDVHRLLPGRRILGVCEGDSDPDRLIPLLARLIRGGRLPVQPLIREYDFADIQAAADDFRSGKNIKTILRFDA